MVYFVLAGESNQAKERGKMLMDWLSKHTSLRVKVSLGQQDTLVEMPSCMTHSAYTEAELSAVGIHPGGIRMAIGWTSSEYIIDCLKAGLEYVSKNS